MKTLLLTFNLLGGLAVFLFGMKLMSDGLQKMAGVKLRHLIWSTHHVYYSVFQCNHCNGGGIYKCRTFDTLSSARRYFWCQYWHYAYCLGSQFIWV